MPSFDVVSEVDLQETRNAVDQANREVNTRFDFKGTDAHFELADTQITLHAKVEFQLQQMLDILEKKLIKRGIDIKCMDVEEPQMNLNAARQLVSIKQGLEADIARKMVKLIKQQKMKVQSQIQGDQLRITGKKRDDLQAVMALLKEQPYNLPLQFTNFRD